MKHNVSQPADATRLDAVVHIRIEPTTLGALQRIARDESRTASNLARKVITDFVHGRDVRAVPLPPALRTQAAPSAATPNDPWNI